jgi:hypothetical protein
MNAHQCWHVGPAMSLTSPRTGGRSGRSEPSPKQCSIHIWFVVTVRQGIRQLRPDDLVGGQHKTRCPCLWRPQPLTCRPRARSGQPRRTTATGTPAPLEPRQTMAEVDEALRPHLQLKRNGMADWAGARAFRFGRRWPPGEVCLGYPRTGRGAQTSCRRSRASPAGCLARWWLPAASPVRSTEGPPQ